jgi:hypothetical protein
VTFQSPLFNNGQLIPRNINLTGATTNIFGNNSVTGTTILSAAPNSASNIVPISTSIQYANPSSPTSGSLSAIINILQTGDTITDINKGDYLKYPTDVEYFQVITGISITQFTSLDNTTNPNLFPKKYLRHQIQYVIADPCDLTYFRYLLPFYLIVLITPFLLPHQLLLTDKPIIMRMEYPLYRQIILIVLLHYLIRQIMRY